LAPGGATRRGGDPMRIDVVTLFPELFEGFLAVGIIGRAVASKRVAVRLRSPRDFGIGRHRSVDDTPYGGGSGMVMRVDCLVRCMEALDTEPLDEAGAGVAAESSSGGASGEEPAAPARAHRVLLTPQGEPFGQSKAIELAARPAIALVCGRYEGFDERVRAFVDEEISLGDFVMTGGEVAAMAVIDACARLLPGVLGNATSSEHESHSPALSGLLEYPQYTRPIEFRGHKVPDVLQQGNHAVIARWRREQAELRTAERRPDLWQKMRSVAPRPDGEGGTS
jgi:tRNA (guanine37-N1)-methyltransferase